MPTIIHGSGGADVSDATAASAQVLEGYSFYAGEDDEIKQGAMKNYGCFSKNLDFGETLESSGGYYGSITVSAPLLAGDADAGNVLEGKTFMNSTGVQTGTMTNHGNVSGSVSVQGTYTLESGYYDSITVSGPTLSGNATAANVLSGKTFYSDSWQQYTGTMANKGTVSQSVGVGGSYNGGEGYYNKITITGPALSGTATAADVKAGATFYSNNGTKQTGTLALSGTATECQVLENFTFYNSNFEKKTGTLKLFVCGTDDLISTSWQSRNTGIASVVAFGVGQTSGNQHERMKCYMIGSTIHWCLNDPNVTRSVRGTLLVYGF